MLLDLGRGCGFSLDAARHDKFSLEHVFTLGTCARFQRNLAGAINYKRKGMTAETGPAAHSLQG